MATGEPGNIEFGKHPSKSDGKTSESRSGTTEKDAQPPASGENRETIGYDREHFTEIGQKVGEGGPKSAPADRQTDEVMDFERTQQPVTGHQDRKHK